MDDTLEYPDDGLRERIHKGFSTSNSNKSKDITDRPKTPSASKVKSTKRVLISKDVTEIEDLKTPKTVDKTEKKSMLKQRSEITDGSKQKKPIKKESPKKTSVNKEFKNEVNTVYLCHTCDKSYKSKAGIKKHMEKCK